MSTKSLFAAPEAASSASASPHRPATMEAEEKVYVAVGKVVKESKSVLTWTLHNNSAGKKICIVLVHSPSNRLHLFGGREEDRVNRILDEYISICQKMGFRAEKLMIENESTVKGILEVISSYDVRNLVMGAASDKNYSRNMMEIKSRKAISVRLQAPVSCQICFVCKGRIIHIREGVSDVGNYVRSFKKPPSNNAQPEQPSGLFRSRSEAHRRQPMDFAIPAQDSLSEVYGYGGGRLSVSTTTITDENEKVPSTPRDTSNEFSPRSCVLSHCSSSGGTRSGITVPRFPSRVGMELMVSSVSDTMSKQHDDDPMMKGDEIQSEGNSSRRESLEEAVRRAKAEKEAFEEFITLKRDALEEAFRRANAEKVAAEAIETAKALETLLSEELKRRKETEANLAKQREEFRNTVEEKLLLEKQMEESNAIMKELEQKIMSAVELLQHYKKERDQLLTERETTMKEAEELKRITTTNSGTWNSGSNPLFPEFAKSEIEEATSNFDDSLKIGEGGFGSIYKAEIRYTQVAVKLLDPNGLQGPSEFHKEVDILSKMRHPNLVTLIGACSESCALIYEYLPNGSLEDRLNCKNNSPPLPWRIRLRIAAEVCSVLIFLHSCKPNSIVHGDVKPSNILLDANFVSKLSDFGIARWLHNKEGGAGGGGSANRTVFWRTDPKGTLAYIDPEFFSTGKLTSKSDVYSFGVILLRLLTGRPAVGLQTEVHCALSEDNLEGVLDPLAGEWPMKQADELARLALQCCEMNRRNRPDLAAEVWRVLKVFLILEVDVECCSS